MAGEAFRGGRATSAVDAVRREEVPALTGLQFLAAFAVLLGHSATFLLNLETEAYGAVYWLRQSSGFGMTLFFVLSGFVIHYNYRIRRHAVAPAVLTLPFNFLFSKRIFDLAAGNGAGFMEILDALPYFLTFTQSWIYFPIQGLPLISVVGAASPLTWSISTEWFFYLCYPLIALLVTRIRLPVTAAIAVVAWCAVWTMLAVTLYDRSPEINEWAVNRFGPIADMSTDLQNSYIRWFLYMSPYVRIGEFVLGCLVGELYLQIKGRAVTDREAIIGQTGLVLAFFSVLVLTYVIYAPGVGHDFFIKLNWNFALAPSAALIIFCTARYDGPATRLFHQPPGAGARGGELLDLSAALFRADHRAAIECGGTAGDDTERFVRCAKACSADRFCPADIACVICLFRGACPRVVARTFTHIKRSRPTGGGDGCCGNSHYPRCGSCCCTCNGSVWSAIGTWRCRKRLQQNLRGQSGYGFSAREQNLRRAGHRLRNATI